MGCPTNSMLVVPVCAKLEEIGHKISVDRMPVSKALAERADLRVIMPKRSHVLMDSQRKWASLHEAFMMDQG